MQPAPRKPWLAALLSLPLAGLGHLYAGSPRRAAAFFGGELVATLVGLFLLVSWPVAPWNMVLGTAVLFGWQLLAAMNAFRYTARQPACAGRSAWIRWPAYAVIYMAAHYGPALTLRATAFEAFRVPTRSMSDTLMPGDRLLATKWNVGSPERGELVVFRMPGRKPWVKRVIGLPGDRVEVRKGIASVNGEPLAEPYALHDGTHLGDYGPTVVPPESYFVLGDNRDRAKDSRWEDVGFVREDQIFARPRAIFWSVDPATAEIRWNRLGRPLR